MSIVTIERSENDRRMVIISLHQYYILFYRYKDGRPLAAAHRFRPMFDFGYVALDILYVYPEDSGVYTLVAKNDLGMTQSQAQLTVGIKKSLYLEAQHPEGTNGI